MAETLRDFGLELRPIPGKTPFLGIILEANRNVVKQVLRHSPAWWVGIDPGDEIVALAGRRLKREQWSEQLQECAVGETVELSVFRRDE